MFFQRKDESPEVGARAATGASGLSADRVLDTLGAVLRALGADAFDISDLDAATIRAACEAWARHVLVGAPAPDNAVTPAGGRNWPAVQAFVANLRGREREYVTRSFAEVRGAVGTFVQGLHRAFEASGEADERVRARLDRLREAVATNSLETMRREAIGAVESIHGILEDRRQAQEAHLAELSGRLDLLKRQLDDAKREGGLDALTRLHNRGAFDAHLRELTGGRPNGHACLLMLDLDHFKKLNDRYGHPAGDAVLRGLAKAMIRTFPRATDFVARYGGEEFAVVLQETSLADGVMLCARLLKTVRGITFEGLPEEVRVTVSIGIAGLRPGELPKAWIERADQALYAAKHGGRDRVEPAD